MLEPNPPRVVVPTSGDTITMHFKDRFLYVNKGSTLAALTVKLPAAPALGDLAVISSGDIITALTLEDGHGDAISGAPGSIAADGTVVMQWVSKAVGWKTSAEATGIVSLGSLGVTATSAEVNLIDGSVAGTSVASKALALGANKNTDVLVVADGGLALGSGAGTPIVATAAEVNRAADVSTRLVTITATGAITEALHEGKTCLLGEVGGDALVTLTLPAATGGGGRYRFVVNVVDTSNYVIKAVSGADVFRGCIIGNDGGGVTTAVRWQAGSTDDTLTLDGTTQGGVTRGDWVEFEDIATDAWAVRGVISQSGTEATPFSDSVA